MPKADKVIDWTYLSAMARFEPSAPSKFLVENNLVRPGPITLDFGCGYGRDAETYKWDRYDPHFFPQKPTKKYAFVVCNYVLNVLPLDQEKKVLREIKNLLVPGGNAYIAVRRDAGVSPDGSVRKGKTKGYRQRWVVLNLPVVKNSRAYCLYQLRR